MKVGPKIDNLSPAWDLRGHWKSFTDYLITESQPHCYSLIVEVFGSRFTD